MLTRLRSNDGLSAFTNYKRWLTTDIAFMMEGGALQVTMRVFFLTTLALISVLAEETSSPPNSPLNIGSVAVGLVETMGPGATAANLEYCNRRCADVANRKLANVQHRRDLTTLSSEQKTTMSSASLRVEVETLISFKEAVTKDFLGALSSWNPNDLSACHWKGVTCDLSSSRVTALKLRHLQLVGSISPLLDRLQYLQNLDLSGNIFSGEIPPSLHNCSKLSQLTLRDNNLTGQIPSQLGELLNLNYLDLSGNFLLGGNFPASLGNCSQLRSLLLNFTNVEGPIPYTVGQLTHLEILNVSATALSGAIPGSLGNCSSLTQLLVGNMYELPSFYPGTLHTMGLSGELPMEMGSLTRLNVFEIRGSEIGGRFPHWIANLTRLTDLTLSYSSFNGEIPQFLGKLPLETFDIQVNIFTGDFPTFLLNCSSLTNLHLTQNTFVGALPPKIGLLNKLNLLGLAENSFSGKIPSSLANCSSMRVLELGVVPTTFQAQSFPSWLTSLVNLIWLSLASTNITGVIPWDIGKLSKLQVLLLWGNSLTGPIPATIGNCSLLQNLELSLNQLSGEVPSEIWLLSQMQRLNLDTNSLTGTIPPSVGNLSQVTFFTCDTNHFNGVIPVELGSMKNLLYLTMSDNGFSGNIPPSLGNTSLACLNLSENHLIGSIPTSISNLTRLQLLYLFGNNLQGSIPGDLMRWTQLTDLELYRNSLSGDIPEDIGKLQSLQILDLNNKKLSGVVPDSLGRCINLLHVDLSFNSFYGIIPPVIIAQLSDSLNSWNVSHNRLSGSLPPELAKLTVITYLDFSANDFSGSIPSGLAECVALTSVDLSNNNLSGSIPQSLIQLKTLAYFNVSDNNLEGPIPDGGIFATNNVTPASFFDNDGRCGSILGRACADVTPSRIAAKSACKGFHCASIRIAVGCGAVGLSSVVLLLIWWFFFRKGESNGTKAEEVVTTFESGLRMYKEDLVNIMARSENVIGVGGTSTVYKGVLGGDRIVAIKTLRTMADDANHDYKQVEADLLREAHVLSKVRHRNILKVLGCFRSDKVVALISEFLPRGSLYDQLYVTSLDGVQRCDLNWDARLHIAVGVAHGLVYLHNQIHEPIIHGDLKPSNILLDQTLEPKLGDFGVSRFVNPERDGKKTESTLCGTTGYIPPEYGTTTTVSTKGDIYSYGVVLLELLTRRHPILAEESETGECGHIVDWVLKSFEEQPIALLDASLIVDAMVNKETQIEEMKLLMRIGLLCTREKPESRPHMTDVLGMLNQILENQSDRVCLPSVAELAHNITVRNTIEGPGPSPAAVEEEMR